MQGRTCAALQEQLRAIAPGTALHRRRYRSEQFDAGEAELLQKRLGLVAGLAEKILCLSRLVRFGTQQGQVTEGRQARRAAFAQGLFGKSEIALLGQLHQ